MTEEHLALLLDNYHISEYSSLDDFMRHECFFMPHQPQKLPTCYECKLLNVCKNDCSIKIFGHHRTCNNIDVVYMFYCEVYYSNGLTFNSGTYGLRDNIVDYNDWTDCIDDLESDDFLEMFGRYHFSNFLEETISGNTLYISYPNSEPDESTDVLD